MSLRKITKNRGAFPSDDAGAKLEALAEPISVFGDDPQKQAFIKQRIETQNDVFGQKKSRLIRVGIYMNGGAGGI